jgi:hypothetical protein
MVRRWGLVALIGLLCLTATGATPTPPPQAVPPVSRLLQLVSDTPDHRRMVTFSDVEAWHASWDVPRVDDAAAVKALPADARARWMVVMPAQTGPPQIVNESLTFDYRARYGFSFFDADRFLQAGQPPNQVTIWEDHADRARMSGALAASGYTSRTLDVGAVLYSRGGDNQIDLKADLPTQGKMGNFNRIAVWDSQMISAKATGVISEALDAHAGSLPSLADAPDYQAAIAALDDPSVADMGPLVGVMFVDGAQLSLNDPAAVLTKKGTPQSLKPTSAGPPLPQYLTVAFATRHNPGSPGASYLVLAVVFPPTADAAAAADILATRIKSYRSVITRTALSDRWSFEKALGVDAGLPVALVVMRVDDPPARTDGLPGAVFSWSRLVYQRDTGFLVVGP